MLLSEHLLKCLAICQTTWLCTKVYWQCVLSMLTCSCQSIKTANICFNNLWPILLYLNATITNEWPSNFWKSPILCKVFGHLSSNFLHLLLNSVHVRIISVPAFMVPVLLIESTVFLLKGNYLRLHCKNSGVVVTPNWGVSELCTSDTLWGVMIL